MCPACIGVSTWLVVGGVSTGGAITLVVNRYIRKTANEPKEKPLPESLKST